MQDGETISAELPYRLALAAVFGATMLIVAYHRLQAAKSGERISHRDEGYVFASLLRVAGLGMWLAVLGYLVNPEWIRWASVPLPAWLRWCGALSGALGCALMAWTLTNLGKNLTDTVVTRSDATLVTTGPYRCVRHPFYLTLVFLIPAAALLTANWLILLGGAAVLAMLVIRTGNEERKLVEKFGDSYRDYMAATGRFWPKMARSRRVR